MGIGKGCGMMIAIWIGAMQLSGCVQGAGSTGGRGGAMSGADPSVGSGAPLTASQAAENFVTVVERVEPLAEVICRQRTRNTNCDFRIVVDDRSGQPANAFQTVDEQGRPTLGFTLALIAEARNADEIAFVLGHEASHHILGHIPRQQQSAMTGAILAGVLASAGGGDQAAIESAQQIGASLASRSYSKEYELQADALGSEIALRAGYDALRGAAFFDRLPDPGDRFLGSHPANAERKAVVREVQSRLTGQSD
jgi:predicted Zn-dependent protease